MELNPSSPPAQGGQAHVRSGVRRHELEGRRALVLVALLLGIAALSDLIGCVGSPIKPAAPVAPRASEAFREARALFAADAKTDQVEQAARRALLLEPDWPAPARFLDDRARDRLAEGRALRERLSILAQEPRSASALYLVGRLEGAEGRARFEEALQLDPSNPWPRHGKAWMLFLAGEPEEAWENGLLACRLARDPWERAHFLKAQASYALALREPLEGLELFERILKAENSSAEARPVALLPGEEAELAAWMAVLELFPEESAKQPEPERAGRGVARGLVLLGEKDLPESSLLQLVTALSRFASVASRDSLIEEMRVRLLERGDAQGLRACVLIEGIVDGSAAKERMSKAFGDQLESGLGSVTLPEDELEVDPLDRDADLSFEIEAGRWGQAIESWRRAQPKFLLGSDDLPLNPKLRQVVVAARKDPNQAGVERNLGQAFLEAGWFRETLSLANWVRGKNNSLAVELEAQARRGLSVVLAAKEIILDVDHDRPRGALHYAVLGDTEEGVAGIRIERPEQEAISKEGHVPSSVVDVLDALAPSVARAYGTAAAEELRASPLLRFGPFATLVHPGPTFSAADQEAGLGQESDPVPGLARLMAKLGRFCIMGTVKGGGGPDGSILRVLSIVPVEGEHLGVPFRGTLAWCEGQDLLSRPGRQGARITGAALHQGYWVDVEAVRDDARRWWSLQRRFVAHAPAGDLEATVRDRGPLVVAAKRPRTALYAPGRIADRVRLAVLLDRTQQAEQGRSKPLVTLEDLLDVVARHEEGHLCDRTRFLPLRSHLLKVLRFAASLGFSPKALARQVEARAQLTALCVAEDPRIPLADLIDALGGSSGVTPHGAAYTELLGDLLELLNGRLEEYPQINPDYFLLHQLPLLGAEDVRRLARMLARRKGLVED